VSCVHFGVGLTHFYKICYEFQKFKNHPNLTGFHGIYSSSDDPFWGVHAVY